MATLVLTALGTAVGGPIGGAIGGLLGNLADRQWLGKAREGPRLTELAVQTSSYGTPIPQLFGTIRVAGTVIWAADLKETRERSGGGKGQPAVNGYSYAASFAVLLSARAIAGIGRIWADGRLIRGAAGDLKVKAMLRVHRGGEDQPVDPLIASAEATPPAYRGCAYMVWEDLPLAEFGNRIPSLTIEVMADAIPVTTGSIARAMAPNAIGGRVPVPGFAASGSVQGVLATIGALADGRWVADADGVRLRRGTDVATEITDAGVMPTGLKGAARSRSIAAVEGVPRTLSIGHYDPARDYQAGVQRAVRPGAGHRDERVEMPAVIDAGAAMTLATTMLARREADRVRRTVTLGFAGLARRPGEIVTIAGEVGRWRVLEAGVEAMAVRLTLAPVAAATMATTAVTSGRVARSPDDVLGATILRLAETPVLDDSLLTKPRLTVVASGQGAGWRRAALLWSIDDGVSWVEAGSTATPGIVGIVESVPDAVPDDVATLIVRLARNDMMLIDADDAAFAQGANLAMAGAELIQFGRAAPLGDARWRLSGLLRGRRGTEASPLQVGDGFALLTADASRVIDLPLTAIGRTVRVMASGAGDDQPAEARCVVTGASLRPPSPVDLRWEPGDGGMLRWTRRSRIGWNLSDGVVPPLGEEAERYRVTLTDANGVREVETVEPRLALPMAAGLTAAVSQRGTWLDSLPATIVLAD
ncbi:hypothetical protein ASG67_09665 [Sphingomonas sp. Leaf339]|uniref:phage tail protein n=1 Tax=Sphingomonas sp. Leaf339 TaxID=1736343 RepID=UPI0006F98BD7|nr:phage tail protein [Sphingomonas sp. Leaf339]KQU53097.1 hypothetical protein ASG67_09665 [Sphingomonas sp. Leaf339]